MNPSAWIRLTSEWINKVMAVRKRHVQLWLMTARVLLCWTYTSAVEADSAARIDASIAADDNHGTSFFNMRTLPHIMIQYIISKGCDYSAAWVLFCISTQPHLGKITRLYERKCIYKRDTMKRSYIYILRCNLYDERVLSSQKSWLPFNVYISCAVIFLRQIDICDVTLTTVTLLKIVLCQMYCN